MAYAGELMCESGEVIAGADKLADAGMMANRAGNPEQALKLLNEASQRFPRTSEASIRRHQTRVRDFLVSAAAGGTLNLGEHWQQVQKAIAGLRTGGEASAAAELQSKLLVDLLKDSSKHAPLIEVLDAELRALFLNIMADKQMLYDLCLKRCLAEMHIALDKVESKSSGTNETETKTGQNGSFSKEDFAQVLDSVRGLATGPKHEMKEWQTTPQGAQFVELLDAFKDYPASDENSAAVLRVTVTKRVESIKRQAGNDRVLNALFDAIQRRLGTQASDEDYVTVDNLPKKSSEEIALELQ